MSSIHTVWGFIRRHKYVVVLAFFIVMVGFVDDNSFWERRQRLQEISALRAEMQDYQNRYAQDSKALEELVSNPEAVVRVAREHYFMKYPNEDVYVFIGEPAVPETANTPEDETAE